MVLVVVWGEVEQKWKYHRGDSVMFPRALRLIMMCWMKGCFLELHA